MSELVVEPTVMAAAAPAGESLHASELLFPAATTTVAPCCTAEATAAFRAVEAPPPKLMLMTQLPLQFAAAKLMPWMTPVLVPLPLPERTLPEHIWQFVATP